MDFLIILLGILGIILFCVCIVALIVLIKDYLEEFRR